MAVSNPPTMAIISSAKGSIIELSWVLPPGANWSNPLVNAAKVRTITVTKAPGAPGQETRTLTLMADPLPQDIVVSTTTSTNDTATAQFYLSGEENGHPEWCEVYFGETILETAIEEGLVYDGSDVSAGTTGSVTNSVASTETAPPPVFGWAMDPNRLETAPNARQPGTTVDVFWFALHKNGPIDLSASEFTLTDGTNSVTGTLSLVTIQRSGPYGPASRTSVFKASFDVSTGAPAAITDLAKATVTATVVPAVAGTNKVMSQPFTVFIDKLNGYKTNNAYVDSRWQQSYTGTPSLTNGNVLVGATSGARALIVDAASNPLIVAPLMGASNDLFQDGETLNEETKFLVSTGQSAVASGVSQPMAELVSAQLNNRSQPFPSIAHAMDALAGWSQSQGQPRSWAGSRILCEAGWHSLGCLRVQPTDGVENDFYGIIEPAEGVAKANCVLGRDLAQSGYAVGALTRCIHVKDMTIEYAEYYQPTSARIFSNPRLLLMSGYEGDNSDYRNDVTANMMRIESQVRELVRCNGHWQGMAVRFCQATELQLDTDVLFEKYDTDTWQMNGDSAPANLCGVNVDVNDIHGKDLGEHTDAIQLYNPPNNSCDNILLYNWRNYNVDYQGIAITGGKEPPDEATNFAVCNCIIEMIFDTGDETQPLGGTQRACGIYNANRNFFIFNATLINGREGVGGTFRPAAYGRAEESTQHCVRNTVFGTMGNVFNTPMFPREHVAFVNIHKITDAGTDMGGIRKTLGGTVQTLFEDTWSVENGGFKPTDRPPHGKWLPIKDGVLDNRLGLPDLIPGVLYDIYGQAWIPGGAIGAAMPATETMVKPRMRARLIEV